jgi:hypothetical protein
LGFVGADAADTAHRIAGALAAGTADNPAKSPARATGR